jgi:1-acyl-sn-glycerol-3-phosphate acyltransferase
VVLGVLFRMRVTSAANIPAQGPLVVVANHESFLDGFVVAAVFRQRRLTFLSAPYLFGRPLVGPFLRLIGALPAHRQGSEVASLREAIRVLEGGGTVVVFPGGGISRTEVHGGAIFLAIKARAPLIPLRITGTKEALPPGRAWPSLFSPVGASVGKLISPSELRAPGVPTGVAVAQGRGLLKELLTPDAPTPSTP